jgi:MFS family permease
MKRAGLPLNPKAVKSNFFSRGFLLALLGYFFLFMSVTLFFIYPLFLSRFHPSQSRVGLIMGVHSLTAILVRPLFGRQIDRKGGRRISLVGLGLLLAVMPFFHLVRDAGWLPILLRALTGLGWGISMTATITMCSDLAPLDRMARSIGIVGTAGLVASALGPMLAEEMARSFGFGWVFNASLGFLLLSFICLLATREIPRPEPNGEPGRVRYFPDLPVYLVFLIASLPVLHGAVRSTVVYFVALFGKSVPLDRVGPFFFAFSAAAILTRFGLGDLSDRFGRKKVIFTAALIIGRRHKGLALGFYLSMFDVGMAVGAPLFGWVSDFFGYRWMYVFAGALLLAFSVLFTLKAPSPEPRR